MNNIIEISDGFGSDEFNDNDKNVSGKCVVNNNVNIMNLDNMPCDSVLHCFSEHTRSTGRPNQGQGTTDTAGHQFSSQENLMSPALVPQANYYGDRKYNSLTNTCGLIPKSYDNLEFEQVRPRHVTNQYKCAMGDTCHYMYNISNVCIMVHFTNWLYYHEHTGNFVYIVRIENLENQCSNGKFYYLQVDGRQNVTLSHCHNVPEGPLTIVHSSWWLICKNNVNMCCQNTGSTDTEVAFENYQKDCVVQQYFHMPYERYMECIIDALIDYQDTVADNTMLNTDNNMSKQGNCNAVCTSTNPVLTVSSNTSVDCSLPIDLKVMLDNNADHKVAGRDIFLPNKTHGHLTLETEYCDFIGPDRQPVEIEDIHQYLGIAQTIKDIGVSNYISARIPIKSDLNLDAWEHHLQDYPDKRLLQYLKFGFPLYLKKPDELRNTQIVNHYSALQYPDQVLQYIDKEINLGAILGPCSHLPSNHFHCSPF